MFAAACASAAELDLGTLMNALAQRGSGRATFVEKKYVALLDKPVESSGELAFTAPDKLEKRTLKPKQESMLLDRDTLTLERGSKKRSLPLADYPEIAAFIESIRATLAGDRGALERFYKVGVEGSLQQWTLDLTPLQPKMVAVIQRVRMVGNAGEVRTIEIFQADGDRSVMTIEKAADKIPEKAPAS